MGEVGGHRSRVGEQGDALAGQRAAQGGVGEQAVDAELEGRVMAWVLAGQRKALSEMEIGLGGAVGERPIALAAVGASMTAVRPMLRRAPAGNSSGAITASRRNPSAQRRKAICGAAGGTKRKSRCRQAVKR
jgi:hypothetical protein